MPQGSLRPPDSTAPLEQRVSILEEKLRAQTVARSLLRRMLSRLARESHLPVQTLRDFGRELADGVDAKDARGFVAAFSAMGLGSIGTEHVEGGRFRFSGHGLIEHTPGAARPTCFLTLGYLEGAVMRIAGSDALGTELACESQNQDQCRFVVSARAGPPR